MKQLLMIMLAGAAGSGARFGMGILARQAFGKNFPYDTLIVNVIGCFIVGFVMYSAYGSNLSETLKTALVVGFLGAFTTFSAFGYATVDFFRQGAWMLGLANTLLNLFVGFFAVWLGMIVGKISV